MLAAQVLGCTLVATGVPFLSARSAAAMILVGALDTLAEVLCGAAGRHGTSSTMRFSLIGTIRGVRAGLAVRFGSTLVAVSILGVATRVFR